MRMGRASYMTASAIKYPILARAAPRLIESIVAKIGGLPSGSRGSIPPCCEGALPREPNARSSRSHFGVECKSLSNGSWYLEN